jgi:hypothetical protein
MPSSLESVSARVGAWFGTDDAWERPRPPVGRQDVLLAATVAVLLATSAVVVLAAERLYRRSLLQTQGRISLRQAWSAPE